MDQEFDSKPVLDVLPIFSGFLVLGNDNFGNGGDNFWNGIICRRVTSADTAAARVAMDRAGKRLKPLKKQCALAMPRTGSIRLSQALFSQLCIYE